MVSDDDRTAGGVARRQGYETTQTGDTLMDDYQLVIRIDFDTFRMYCPTGNNLIVLIYGGKLYTESQGYLSRVKDALVFNVQIQMGQDPAVGFDPYAWRGSKHPILFIEGEIRVRDYKGLITLSTADTVSDEARGIATVAALFFGCSDFTFWENQ